MNDGVVNKFPAYHSNSIFHSLDCKELLRLVVLRKIGMIYVIIRVEWMGQFGLFGPLFLAQNSWHHFCSNEIVVVGNNEGAIFGFQSFVTRSYCQMKLVSFTKILRSCLPNVPVRSPSSEWLLPRKWKTKSTWSSLQLMVDQWKREKFQLNCLLSLSLSLICGWCIWIR